MSEVGLVGLWYLLSNWETTVAVFEEYLPLVGAVIEESVSADLVDSIDNGEMTYQQLSEGLEDVLDMFVNVEWPEGVNYESDDLIQVLPDHIWILFPGTELVICDLINAKAFFESLPFSELGNIVLTIMGIDWDSSVAGMFFHFAGAERVPWTHKLKYQDGTTGEVKLGEDFVPEKNITWGQVEPYVIKSMVIGVILFAVKKFGIFGKIIKALKAGKSWRSKQIMRNTLTQLSAGQTLITEDTTSLITKVIEIDKDTSRLITNMETNRISNEGLLKELAGRLGLKLVL